MVGRKDGPEAVSKSQCRKIHQEASAVVQGREDDGFSQGGIIEMRKSNRFQPITAVKLIGPAKGMDMMGEEIRETYSSEQINKLMAIPLTELVKHAPEIG